MIFFEILFAILMIILMPIINLINFAINTILGFVITVLEFILQFFLGSPSERNVKKKENKDRYNPNNEQIIDVEYTETVIDTFEEDE